AYIINSKNRDSMLELDMMDLPQGSGTGIVWDHDGHIITNFHVIENAESIDVTLYDQSVWRARYVGGDPNTDLAVIRVGAPQSRLQPILLGTSHDLQVGQKVLAIGNPFGLDTTLTTGIISAVGRSIKSLTPRPIYDVIQTDAAINPGNSGGPLLDSYGRLIGVNAAIVSNSGRSEGVGFAIPVDTVNRVIPELIANGVRIRPYLGVILMPETMAIRWQQTGVPIMRVFSDTPAADAGLSGLRMDLDGRIQLGDIIVAIGDTPVKEREDVLRILDRYHPNDSMPITVQRGEEQVTLMVHLGAR
ncbi:MAG: trypsin-like peptidase domain-containing protein, partial [bacterium]|nr:trypsin-like peptidase domain-containing protein [bacterium]